jgi:hypothetical protein
VASITSTEKVIISGTAVTGLLYQAYTLWIVKAFVLELSQGRRRRKLEDDEQGEPLQDIQKS